MGGKRRAAGRTHKNARARSRSPRAGAEAEIFPWLVCLGCLFCALYLFLSSTVPALRERKDLSHKDKTFLKALQETRWQTEDLRIRRADLPHDPTSILVALDELGLTPEEAMSRFGIDPSGRQDPRSKQNGTRPGKPR